MPFSRNQDSKPCWPRRPRHPEIARAVLWPADHSASEPFPEPQQCGYSNRNLQGGDFQFLATQDFGSRGLAIGTAELLGRRHRSFATTGWTVHQNWDLFDDKTRPLERSAFASDSIGELQRTPIHPGEYSQLEMDSLHMNVSLTLHFLEHTFNHAQGDGKFMHEQLKTLLML